MDTIAITRRFGKDIKREAVDSFSFLKIKGDVFNFKSVLLN